MKLTTTQRTLLSNHYGRTPMSPYLTGHSKAVPHVSLLTLALGAAAFGAVAIGAVAIGRLALGRLTIKKAHFQKLEVDELSIRRLHVIDAPEGLDFRAKGERQ
jgi:hypothetical protein